MYKQKAATYDMDQVVSCEVVGRYIKRQPSKATLDIYFIAHRGGGQVEERQPSKTTLDIFLSEVRTG